MKNLKTREFMGRLYRLIEEYEEPPKPTWREEMDAYFEGAANAMIAMAAEYPDNAFATELLVGWYSAIEKQYLTANPLPLPVREKVLENAKKVAEKG